MVDNSPTRWTEPEWGFPKGRRNNYETDLICAIREYEEETGYLEQDFEIIQNILPYEESFIGSNYKSYKHKYFVARSVNSIAKFPFQPGEVSNIGWFSYDTAVKKIRSYNVERKELLCAVNSMINDSYISF